MVRPVEAICGAALAFGLAAAQPSLAQPEGVLIRVVDVGPGLCSIAVLPSDFEILYDAGHWESTQCLEAVRELVPDGVIDLLVISHPDADHLGELTKIVSSVRVRKIVHTGAAGTSNRWKKAMEAIEALPSTGPEQVEVINLQTSPLPAPTKVGDAQITFVAGWPQWNLAWSDKGKWPTPAERRNVISIVMRLDYRGRSVLFTGDTIGRRLGDVYDACRDAERRMVEAVAPLKSDVVLAPHHGGDNGSSTCFIQAVQPEYVIFPAGHDHNHPTQTAATRYLAAKVPLENLFRTDRGDHESKYEWAYDRIPGCEDLRGDDDVEVRLAPDPKSRPAVRYRTPNGPCRK